MGGVPLGQVHTAGGSAGTRRTTGQNVGFGTRGSDSQEVEEAGGGSSLEEAGGGNGSDPSAVTSSAGSTTTLTTSGASARDGVVAKVTQPAQGRVAVQPMASRSTHVAHDSQGVFPLETRDPGAIRAYRVLSSHCDPPRKGRTWSEPRARLTPGASCCLGDCGPASSPAVGCPTGHAVVAQHSSRPAPPPCDPGSPPGRPGGAAAATYSRDHMQHRRAAPLPTARQMTTNRGPLDLARCGGVPTRHQGPSQGVRRPSPTCCQGGSSRRTRGDLSPGPSCS